MIRYGLGDGGRYRFLPLTIGKPENMKKTQYDEIEKRIALWDDIVYNNPTDGIRSMPYVIGENLWHRKNFRI